MSQAIYSSQTSVRDIIDPVPDHPDEYGIDPEGPLPFDPSDENIVIVPATVSPLNAEQLERYIYVSAVDPLEECDDFGIEKFVTSVQLLEEMVNEN